MSLTQQTRAKVLAQLSLSEPKKRELINSSGLTGATDGIWGDAANLTGKVSEGLTGNISGLTGVISEYLYGVISEGLTGVISVNLTGNISGLTGDVTGIIGSADEIKKLLRSE